MGLARLRAERWRALTVPRTVIHHAPFESPQINKQAPREGVLVCWRRRWDSLPAGKPRHGSDVPPARHSLPCRSNPLKSTNKHPVKGCLFVGGEGGIRTHEALLTPTRFPVVRPRPAKRLLRFARARVMPRPRLLPGAYYGL